MNKVAGNFSWRLFTGGPRYARLPRGGETSHKAIQSIVSSPCRGISRISDVSSPATFFCIK